MRALPNMLTAGRTPFSRSAAIWNSAIIPSTRHASCPLVEYSACGSIISGILWVCDRMAKLVLVDGSSYLYRAFHALPDLRTSKGEPTGALRGVQLVLRRLVIDDKPDYFADVFDAPGRTFRDAWYAEYKANRTAMPDDHTLQIAPLHELVRAHGWPLLMIEGVEADDVIGTLAREARAAKIETLISTSDKDLAQLVGPGVPLVNTMTNERLDDAGVVAKFGVRPDQLIDLLALTGDSIDNVPGVAKVGPKTAAKWLTQYESLDNLISRAHEVGGVVGENLRQALEWLPQGRRLLTVRVDCELPSRVADLTPGEPALDRLQTLYERFEFKGWLRDLGRSDVAVEIAPKPMAKGDTAPGANETPAPPTIVVPPVDYETVQSLESLERWMASIEAADAAAPAGRVHSARASVRRRAGAARPARRPRAARAVAVRRFARQARPGPQIRATCARQPRHRARRRDARHVAAVLRARVAQAARSCEPRITPSRSSDAGLRRGHGKGCRSPAVRAGRALACDRIRRDAGRCRVAIASASVSADRARRQA